MHRRPAAALVLLLTLQAAVAHAAAWQPPPGHTQLPLWPSKPPNAAPVTGPETAANVEPAKYVAGRTWAYVRNVSTPTITVYSPKHTNTGAAVVVFPGGGYNVLAIDLEGSEACEWLASRGITAVLLKYRVPCAVVGPHRDCPTALQDAQRALSLVRSHAAEWQVDPRRIGVLGFSAGGHMVASISTHEQRVYAPVDSADRQSWRPDFAVALYPGHLATRGGTILNSDIQVTAQTPPTFLVQAQDDPIDPVENSIVYHKALKQAGVPSELHVFEKGRHGFGLRQTKLPITRWPELMEKWLHTIGVLAR